jgi:hypothetical protein
VPSAQVAGLRSTIEAEAGLVFELVDPSGPGFAARAAELFLRDGFCLVRDALSPDAVETVRAGCDAVARRILALDPQRHGPGRPGAQGWLSALSVFL